MDGSVKSDRKIVRLGYVSHGHFDRVGHPCPARSTTAHFPEILYEAPTVSVTKMADMLYSAALNRNLTMHRVTRSQPITTRVTLLGTMLRASGDFSLNQTDYNIKLVSIAGGALKLKNELKFSFEIVARKQG